jgi:exodeoxyribonuclease VII large subunit
MPPAPPEVLLTESAPRPLTVTEFTRRVKDLLVGGIGACSVKGEVSNVKAQANGHVYFTLKDAGAQLPAVIFRGEAARQTVRLRDGLQVVAIGEIDVYPPHGRYQLKVRLLIDDGQGSLQRAFEDLKRRLAEEGLFAAEGKKPIPAMPSTVGFVTSPGGAAVQDFMRILIRRGWRGRVVVLPARVQGEGAALEMAGMLGLAQSLGLFDLLVIGRGGGSIEDLWAFNEEPLVRAVAACRIPTISAVGHETDFTLCDFAADRRAETPSAAAELISSHFLELATRTRAAGEAIEGALSGSISRARERLAHARTHLRLLSPQAFVENAYQRLDDLAKQLGSALRHTVRDRRDRLERTARRFERAAPETRVLLRRQQLDSLSKRLEGASPHSVLNRGFVILRDEAGRPVVRSAGVRPGQRLEAEFADGRRPLRAERD